MAPQNQLPQEIMWENTDEVQATVRIKTAHHHANLFFDAGIKEYSQWFLGQENNVADTISRDFDRSDNELTQIIRNTCPSQLPQLFQISPLPNEISLWLTSLLLKLPVKEQLREAHTRTKLGRCTASPSIFIPSESAKTSSLIPSQDLNKTRSSKPLPWLSGRDGFWDKLMTPWLWEKFEISSRIYLQPSRKTADPARPRTTTYILASFYIISSEPSKTKTPKKSNKKPSPPVSSPKLQNKN
jgi:hypothetical protein